MTPAPRIRPLTGDLEAFGIFDLTQSLMLGQRTAVVTLSFESRRGYVSFKEGQIVGALDDSLRGGEEALASLFGWRRGQFTVEFDRPPMEVNISTPTDSLLLGLARHFDEAKQESGDGPASRDEDVKDAVCDRVSDELRQRVNRIFKRVANSSEPARARYTRSAFDTLLRALLDLGGQVLLLRPGEPPRVRVGQSFSELREAALSEDEIDGFLALALSEAETSELREAKETSTFFHTEELGAFRMTAILDHGTPVLTFALASRPLPSLSAVLGGEALAAALRQVGDGLLLVAGPLGLDRSVVTAALIQDRLDLDGAFAVHYAHGLPFAYRGGSGACIVKAMPASPRDLARSLRTTLESEPSVLAFDDEGRRETFALAAAASAGRRLVIYAMESQSRATTLIKLARLASTGDGEDLGEVLAERLRWVIDLAPGAESGHPQVSALPIGREEAALIRAGRSEDLRRLQSSRAG
jgi:Tfp pilus assembly pilus retraction ATPase PilT